MALSLHIIKRQLVFTMTALITIIGYGILVGRPFPPYYDWCRISTGRIKDIKIFGEKLKEFYS